MVRRKNKGFSLIEVVVAVAILTLLISPILVQVFQTLSVSDYEKIGSSGMVTLLTSDVNQIQTGINLFLRKADYFIS